MSVDLYKLVIAAKLSKGGDAPTPTGTMTITQNGTYDVTDYASADVNVGGGGIGELLKTVDLGHLETTSTSTVYGTTIAVDVENYDMLLCVAVGDSSADGYHKSTVAVNVLYGNPRSISNKYRNIIGGITLKKVSDDYAVYECGSTSMFGVWTDINSVRNNVAALQVKMCYNSALTGNIDANYTLKVYGINLLDLFA